MKHRLAQIALAALVLMAAYAASVTIYEAVKDLGAVL